PASKQRSGVDKGVEVTDADGPAAEAGLRPGDVITRLNNQEIDSVETLAKVIDALKPGRSVPVLIVRGQAPTFLALHVPEGWRSRVSSWLRVALEPSRFE